ncbi:hypothetical protein PV396_30075 [Streptomyces sp. ME02-8801-2C]|uniref:hypothetical protein n=1 Tax=Streptomyces sp. ME02-8801-2C TaxID=3028680 RepID=UPI0029BB8066|nr:hypothetical protein [Streptomyces sp. ME02-8801-2C]MDX3456139.1 hypothetical protein [Streptomyces sp. ME02-8801-2C]
MTPEQRGATAPWAKALGAVLLALTVTLVVSWIVGDFRESAREHTAFENTREDARRFADALVADSGTLSRQDVEDILERASGNGRGHGLLYELNYTKGRTQIIVRFARVYQRSVSLIGPSESMAKRCFTVDLPTSAASPKSVRIVAHGADDSCTEVAARAR